MIEVTAAKIHSAVKECDSHIEKLKRGRRLLSEFFPVSENSFKTLSEEEIEHIDQFIYRFTRLQDSMGKRLFPSMISYLDNDYTSRPFLDILTRLEQLGIITSGADWQFFRNLRNNLAHDYPDNIKIMTETLNLLFSQWQRMEDIYTCAREYWSKKIKEK